MEIKIKYKLKAKDGTTYTSDSYTLKEIEDCCEVEEMIWNNESKCSCCLSESNPSCECGGYLGNWNDDVEFEIQERILEVEEINNIWKEELKDFDIVHKEYSKAKKDVITSPKFIERKVNKKLSSN